MSDWKRICCAVDFSEESRFALEEAAELAARSAGELAVVHVVGERSPREARLPYRSEVSHEAGDVGRQLEVWRHLAERIAGTRTHVSASVLTGAPVDELLRFAREGHFDVLVVGTPGMLGCERIAFGSVAEGVVRRAPCNVVVARRRGAATGG